MCVFCEIAKGKMRPYLHIFPRYEGDGFGWTFGEQHYECNQNIADKIKSNMR